MRFINLVLALLLFPSVIFAAGVMTDAAGPIPANECGYHLASCIADDFVTGSTTSGSIGSAGWSSTGTVTTTDGEANHPGIINISTGAVSGTVGRLNGLGNNTFPSSASHSVLLIGRLKTNDANTTIRIGSAGTLASNPAANGIYFEKLDADTNWFVVTRSSGTQTRVDTGIAVDTGWHTFAYLRDVGGVRFSIDGASVGGVLSTNVPTSNMHSGLMIVNSAAAAKTFDLDYLMIRVEVTR